MSGATKTGRGAGLTVGGAGAGTAFDLPSTFTTPVTDPTSRIAISSETPKYHAFPGICRTPDGRLLVAWRRASAHANSKGTFYKSYSSDNGVTWTTPAEFYTHATLDARSSALTTLSDGRISCTMELCIANPTTHAPNGCYVMYSSDNGVTWTAPQQLIDTFVTYSLCAAPLVEITPGVLLWPFYGRDPTGTFATYQTSRCMKSTDNGVTWGSETTILAQASKNNGEPNVVKCADGTLLACVRGSTDGLILRRRSSDSGATWSAVGSGVAGDGKPALLVSDSGRVHMVTRRAPASGTGEALLYTSTDSGATWVTSTGKVIDTGATQYMEYAEMIRISPGIVGHVMGVEAAAQTTDSQIVFRYLMEKPGLAPDGRLYVPGMVGEQSSTTVDGNVVPSQVLPALKTVNTNLSVTEQMVVVDATGGARSMHLPNPLTVRGKRFVVKKIDSSGNAVTVDCATANVDASTISLASQWDRCQVVAGVAADGITGVYWRVD